MAVDRQARTDLQEALVRYMTGTIHTFAFDDQNSSFFKSVDRSVGAISRFLYQIHDDLIDHPISVTSHGWTVLRRVVAFLGTGLEIEVTPDEPSWPFRDEREWHANEHLLDAMGLPEYVPAVHGRPANPWWNRIPSGVGFALLAGIVAAVLLTLLLW